MNKYFRYLKYIIRHKWFVFWSIADLPDWLIWGKEYPWIFFKIIWLLVIHDLSKFLPSEFFSYADFFYGKNSPVQKGKEIERVLDIILQNRFDAAWLKHIHRNPHHWQYWVLREDQGNIKIVPMPRQYLVEMLCDWQGASRAIRGKNANAREWYRSQWNKMQLHAETREIVDKYMGI